MRKALLLLSLLVAAATTASAQTTLSAGDIYLTGFNADGDDDFSFVTFVELEEGTQIKFTDFGWNSSTNSFTTANEGTVTYTAPSGGLAARTVVVVSDPGGSPTVVDEDEGSAEETDNGYNFSGSGDQILVYQGDESNPTFIFALNTNSTGWEDSPPGGSNESTESNVPPGLTVGETALNIADADDEDAGADTDNGQYIGPRTSDTPRDAIENLDDNWNFENDAAIPLSSEDFADEGTLPVELALFEAVADGPGTAILRWATASEQNNAGFEVQHAVAGGPFEAATFVAGHGTTAEPQRYAFRAEALVPGRHTFRLKQVDLDGTVAYSPTVELALAAELPEGYRLGAAYPNPFNPTATFELQVQQAQEVRVGLYDVLGREVAVLFDGVVEAGQVREVAIDGGGLPSGLYLYRAEGETFQATRQVTLIK